MSIGNFAKKLQEMIKNPRVTMIHLLNRGLLNWLSDERYLQIRYYIVTGKNLNLEHPKTFTEKLQWLKLNDRNPSYVYMVDKCAAKEYVANLIGNQYIIPTLGVWNCFEDIDFDKLPQQFVLKCNHDSGGVIVCRDKNKFNKQKAAKFLNKRLKINYFYAGRQQSYKNIKPKLIVEQYLEADTDAEDSSVKGLVDYKFYCFNGEPHFLYISKGLEDHRTARISYATLEWEKADFHRHDYMEFEQLPPQPACFEKMIELSRILARGHYFLRVDFYEVNEKVYFGELTFYPGNGMTLFEPEEYEEQFGDLIKIPTL